MENTIIKLFKESGMSVREFATKADLKYSTAHDIVTGKANIENVGAGAFVRIAHVLGTTADALLGAEVDRKEKPSALLTASEKMLLSLYRSMDPVGRASLIEQAEFLSARHPLNTEAETA